MSKEDKDNELYWNGTGRERGKEFNCCCDKNGAKDFIYDFMNLKRLQ